jgi:hypothetical protein
MRLIAIDPGTRASGYVEMDGNGRILLADKEMANADVLNTMRTLWSGVTVAIEKMSYQGPSRMVGTETFDTCEWIGRFDEAARPCKTALVTRNAVLKALRAENDSQVAFAVRELYGGQKTAVGTKRAPGPLYGVGGHALQALAVGVVYLMQQDPDWTPEGVGA